MAINYDELEQKLATMTERSVLFAIVKKEMAKRGHWKRKPKGKPFQKGDDPRRHRLSTSSEGSEYIRNSDGQVVMIRGRLPDGTYGIIADEEKPFTDEELQDASIFSKHRDDLNNRLD